MMEQLAERRMQREEDAQYPPRSLRHQPMQPHNHGPPLDEDGDYEEEDDDDEDEDFDSPDEEYDEEMVVAKSCTTIRRADEN